MENQPDKNNKVPNKDNVKQEGTAVSNGGNAPMRIEPSTEILSRLKGNQPGPAAAQPKQPQPAGVAPGGIYTPAQAGVQAAGKMPMLFKILMIFSGIFLVAGISVGVIALLDAPVPDFMKPVVDFIGKFFISKVH